MVQKHLITLKEFASVYSISRASIYREVTAGRLRFVKIGKRSLIDTEDAEQWRAALPRTGTIVEVSDACEVT